MIIQDTIPQKPVEHMSSRYFVNIEQECNANKMLIPFLLLFSGNVSHQTSNNLRSVSQKLTHKSLNQKITGCNRRAKFSRESDTAKLTEPFIASHLLVS